MQSPGIYVEIRIEAPLDTVWRLTQEPALHQRWDLRFTRIEYLPRPDLAEPQHFLYETRIGFGLAIRGTGESLAERATDAGDTTSSLKFASADAKSLIRTGSGYWRYVPTPQGLRFLTWYDYQVRFGAPGRLLDHTLFRPLMGWATAWSFDRLRLWAERGQAPELSLALALIYALARLSVASIFVWHGLVPKLLYHHIDEQRMLLQSGVPAALVRTALNALGTAEVLFGALLLLTWRRRSLFLFTAVLMLLATVAVAARSPAYLPAAFTPVTLNLATAALAIVGWLAAPFVPSARSCRRAPPPKGAL